MATVYRTTDLIEIKIGDVSFHVSPLTKKQKTDILSTLAKASGVTIEDAAESTALQLKYMIKGVEGITYPDGEKYVLERDEQGLLTDNTIDELLNLETNAKLNASLQNFLRGIPDFLADPNTGEKIEGVELVKTNGAPKK